jgi:lipoprotein-releasing system ATP-binding protein
MLYLMGLLDVPTAGHILLNGTDTSSLSQDKLADVRLAELGFVFQFHFLLPEFTALENVMLPMQRLGKRPGAECRKHGTELLGQLGLEGQEHKYPRQLSGGQAQRVAIARALANDPVLILADEPTGNLDTHSSANVQTILHDLAHTHGRAVAVVTHDTGFAAKADRVITIVDGKIQ